MVRGEKIGGKAMPKYKNSFSSSSFVEKTILDSKEKTIGTIRIKPVSISWKPANQSKFFTVSFDDFVDWITDPKTKVRKTK